PFEVQTPGGPRCTLARLVTVRAQDSAARAQRDAVERLVPYVPLISLEWLAETPEMRHRQIEGTLVFADVSGFTQLTEKLTRKGKIGGEEMNDLLGACFTELLDVAYAYGGGVVKWGGDAALLLFHDEGHTERACRAARDAADDALGGTSANLI